MDGSFIIDKTKLMNKTFHSTRENHLILRLQFLYFKLYFAQKDLDYLITLIPPPFWIGTNEHIGTPI